jgi:hypothetical protein
LGRKYITSTNQRYQLAKELGIVENSGNEYLHFSIHILLKVLIDTPLASSYGVAKR